MDEPGAGWPLSISARVTKPLSTSSSVTRGEPFFVVAHAQIVGGREQLDLVAAGVHAPLAPGAGGDDSARMTRPSQGAWNTGSFFSYSNGPKSCMPPMSWTPFIALLDGDHLGDADHGVARDQRGELLFVQFLASGRALRQDQIAQFSGAVPDAHFRLVRPARARTRATRRADRSPRANDTAPICTTPAAAPEPTRDNRSTACKR